MKQITFFKSSAFGLSFFLASCDYVVNPIDNPVLQESPARAFSVPAVPAALRGFDLPVVPLGLSLAGPVDVPPSPICDVADLVIGKAVQVPFTCSGTGTMAITFNGSDPTALLALFVTAVERQGGSVAVSADGVTVVGVGGESAGFESFSLPGSDAFEPVPGIDAVTIDDLSDYDDIKDISAYWSRGFLAVVPNGISSDDVLSLSDNLGFDLEVVSVGSTLFMLGAEEQTNVVLAVFDNSADTVVSYPAPYLTNVAVSAFSKTYPRVRFDLDDSTSTLYLGGFPPDVASVMGDLSNSQPDVSRVRIEGLFFSYEASDLSSLETDLTLISAPYSLRGGDLGLGLSTGGATFTAPFSLIVDHVERSSFAQIVSEPSVTSTFGFPAVFRSGADVPVRTSVDPETGAEVVEYRETGLTTTFEAVPIGSNLVRVTVSIAFSSIDGLGVLDNPNFDTRSIQTTVDLRRGDTVLLSGLSETQRSSSEGVDFFLPSSAGLDATSSLGLFVTLR